MVTLGLIHVGDLKTYVELIFIDTSTSDINSVLNISTATLKKITFIDPNGALIGPFDLTFVTDGSDGRAYYYTDAATSQWSIGGIWKWFGTVTISSVKVSTNDVLREVLSNE